MENIFDEDRFFGKATILIKKIHCWCYLINLTTFSVRIIQYLLGKKSRHKILSVKKIVGKIYPYWQNNSSLFTDDFFCLDI